MLIRYIVVFVVLAVAAIAVLAMRRHVQAERAEAATRLERLRRQEIAQARAQLEVCRQQSVETLARLKARAAARPHEPQQVA
jgi:hypothetical protein